MKSPIQDNLLFTTSVIYFSGAFSPDLSVNCPQQSNSNQITTSESQSISNQIFHTSNIFIKNCFSISIYAAFMLSYRRMYQFFQENLTRSISPQKRGFHNLMFKTGGLLWNHKRDIQKNRERWTLSRG